MIRHWRFGAMMGVGLLAGWLLSQARLDQVFGQGTKPPADAAKPRFEFHTNGWLKLRPEGDADFERAKKFGYEVIRDRETGNVLYGPSQ